MILKIRFVFCLFLINSIFISESAAEIAELDAPLKDSYSVEGGIYGVFFKTGKIVDSFSMICDMGQAIPDTKKTDWYINKPIYGLKLELRARIAIIDIENKIKPMGFVVVTKSNEVLTKFTPIGDYVNGRWDGDVFNSWSGTSTDIEVFSERFGRRGYAHFDLLSGNGFYYKSESRENPDYFLYGCKRIKKTGLPLYDWKAFERNTSSDIKQNKANKSINSQP